MRYFLALQIKIGTPIQFYGVTEAPQMPKTPVSPTGEHAIYVEITKAKYQELLQVMVDTMS